MNDIIFFVFWTLYSDGIWYLLDRIGYVNFWCKLMEDVFY